MSAIPSTAVEHDTKHQTDKRLDLIRRFTLAGFANTTVFERIPSESMLFLLPDHDPEYVRTEVQVGAQAALRGEDVFFRHIRVAELPK